MKKYRFQVFLFWFLFTSGVISFFSVFYLASIGYFGDMPDFRQLENPKTNFASEIISSDNKNLPLIMDLCDMYGEEEIIEEAKNTYKDLGNKAISYLDHLNKIVKALNFDQSVKIHIDIGEVQGFKYHNGIVFSAYSGSAGYALAKGGRYDGLRKTEEEDRPAIGFDLDLIAVSNVQE